MLSKNRLATLALVVCAQLAYISTASAFEFWTQKDGVTICFIYMDGGSDEGLFGDPIIVNGDTFVFTPEAFRAQSVNGEASIVADRLEVHIWAHEGMSIAGIDISETGDYGIVGTGAVAATGSMFAVDTENPRVESDALVTNPVSPITTGAGTWTGSASVDLTGGTPWEHLVLVFDNNLIATSGTGSASFIQKKEIDIHITWIPEPASLAMLGLGSLVMFARRRRAL